MSQSTPQLDASASDRTANLLNLLKFNQAPSRSNSQSAIPAVDQNGDAPARGAQSSLRAPSGLMRTQSTSAESRKSAESPQDMLLSLLKRPESNTKPTDKPTATEGGAVRETTPVKVFGTDDGSTSPFQPSQSSKGGKFSYVNPFEQLQASSPRAKSPRPGAERPKSSSKESSSVAPAARSAGQAEIKAEPKGVAEALSNVAEQADKDVQQALESMEQDVAAVEEIGQKDPEALREVVHDAAVEVQDELKDGKTKTELEKAISKPVADALQETVDNIAEKDVADSWESADVEGKGADEYTVHVYNLPMRPFVSLDIKGDNSTPSKLRPDVTMKIASLKKEFDQIDRTLASASPNYIVYAMTKGGGFRVIRQDDGVNKTVFRGSENQVFNVAIAHSPSLSINKEMVEPVLATGVNGSVYWTSIPVTEDSLDDYNLDKRGFVMPPLPSTDDNTSTSQLKTRAKKSSRHPEFFAVGRGKSIYLVWPTIAGSDLYTDPQTRVVDTQKYFHQRCLKIGTGKAGKDFTFSEDDTVIVSLDKHGRLKFWDITEHLEMASATQPGRPIQLEAKVPLTTLWLASSNSKAWPTSVQFVDKERPTLKGIALRYLLVGLKQNHTIQLWDLGLGKAVQEINLPHANETDAICSIGYHARSGIIAVGHPTRNSIYLIHLSAPKYTMPSMTQSKYVRQLADEEKRLPKPDSTAIMSGLREISLSSIGSMRSIDVLAPSVATPEKEPQDEETIFEIYAMHSRGVTCLNLKRSDLGWGKDGKVMHGRDAIAEDLLAVTELQASAPVENGQPEDAKPSETASKTLLKPTSKSNGAAKDNDGSSARSNEATSAVSKAEASTSSKTEKKKERKKPDSADATPAAKTNPSSYADALSRATAQSSSSKASQPSGVSANGTVLSNAPPAETIVPDLGANMPSPDTFAKLLSENMDNLFNRMDEQRRVQEAAGAARQDAVLRLVSATLTENVEKSLDRIVTASIQDNVLPAVSKIAASSVEDKVPEVVSKQVSASIPRALHDAIPDAIAKSLQAPGVLQTISEQVSAKLAPDIKKQFTHTLQSNIMPSFQKSAVDASIKATTEIDRRVVEQLSVTQRKLEYDAQKIETLTRLNNELTSTVTDMANMQAQLHKEMAAIRTELRSYRDEAQQAVATRSVEQDPPKEIKQEEKGDEELESISQAMTRGNIEEGVIRWLQSPNQSHLFDKLFASLPPDSFLPSLNPIVNLSVSAAVSATLAQGKLQEKLAYLETVLDNVDPKDEQVFEYAPRMMDVLNERLSEEYMRLDEEKPGDGSLGRIRELVRAVRVFKQSCD